MMHMFLSFCVQYVKQIIIIANYISYVVPFSLAKKAHQLVFILDIKNMDLQHHNIVVILP